MEGIHIDLTRLAAIWIGGTVLLVPLLGLSLRFGLVPLLDAWARVRAAGGPAGSAEVLRRLDRLEGRLTRLSTQVERLTGAGVPTG